MAKEVKVKLKVDSKTGQANIKKVSKDVSRLERQTNKSTSSMSAGFKKLAGPVAIGAVVFGFTKLLTETVKLGDKFDKLNKKLGFSVPILSKLEHIANLSGVSFTIVTSSIERMQRRIGLATRGLGAAKKAFEELNIDVEALSELNPEEQFLRLAEASLKIENPIKRAGVQFELFGMTAAELNKMLPGLRDKLSKTGAAITDAQAKTFAEYTDNMAELSHTMKTFKVSVFGEIVKGMNEIFDTISSAGDDIGFFEKAFWGPKGRLGFKGLLVEDIESAKTGIRDISAAQRKALGLDKPEKEPEKKDDYVSGVITPQAFDIDAYATTLEEKAQVLKDAFVKEQELKAEMLAFDMELRDLDLQHQIDKAAKEKEIDEKRLEEAKKIAEAKKQMLKDLGSHFGEMGSVVADMASMGIMNDKKAFKVQKGLKIAEATIKTYSAATDALDDYPGAAGIAMAALITATGLANVATIAKTEPKFAKGGAFTNSVVSSPTQFNIGEMGEAGPEAILPLTKTAGGELGVKSQGGGQTIVIHNNVSAMDSESFANFTRRNPGAMVAPIIEQMQRGNQALNNIIRSVNQ